jgi:hypothetical protein
MVFLQKKTFDGAESFQTMTITLECEKIFPVKKQHIEQEIIREWFLYQLFI